MEWWKYTSQTLTDQELLAINRLWKEMGEPTTLDEFEWNDWLDVRNKMLAEMRGEI